MQKIRYISMGGIFLLLFLPLLEFSTLAIPLIVWTILTIIFVVSFLVFFEISELNYVDLCINLFIFYLAISSLTYGKRYDSSQYYYITLIWCLYPVLKTIFIHSCFERTLIWTFLICSIFEITWGLLQMMGLLDNGNSFFIIGGTFGNPGIYSAYLSLLAPFILTELINHRQANNENAYLACLGCFFLLIFLIIASFSRGSLISLIVGCAFVLIRCYNFKIKLKILLPISLIGLFVLYIVKRNSADGRFLIWKIVSKATHSNWLFGEGIGSFRIIYPKWQSEYFSAGQYTNHEWYIADYVTTAYNEFLHLFVEQGIIGCILFTVVLLKVFSRKNEKGSYLFIPAKASLIGMTILMLTSYPLDYLPTNLHLIILLAILNSQNNKKSNLYVYRILLFVISVYFGCGAIKHEHSMKKLIDAERCLKQNRLKETEMRLREVNNTLKNNEYYLYIYADYLWKTNHEIEAVELLEKALPIISNPGIYQQLGDLYWIIGKRDSAIKMYNTMANIQPSRTYPRYKLIKALIMNNQRDEAQRESRILLEHESKIPSAATNAMREEIKGIFK